MCCSAGMSFADEIQQRVYELAMAVVGFCRTLPKAPEATEMARQLRRASLSASANYRASRRGRSPDEWLAKLGVVVEELDEAEHWLTALRDAEIAIPPQDLIRSCRQLRAILATSCATARRRKRKKRATP